jgi:GxxExxY protein
LDVLSKFISRWDLAYWNLLTKLAYIMKWLNQDCKVEKEKPLPLVYEEVKLDCGYRLDFIVEGKIIVEIKSVDCLNDIHLAQVLTYLKLTNNRLELLINFNVLKLTDGIKRVINGY